MKMSLNFFERKKLDEKLSSTFKKWDVIANTTWELIWIFESVAYHWWNPEYSIWNWIFADFSKAISKQWRDHWEVFPNWCWDDDVYIDRRNSTLSKWYRLATQEEKELFETLIAQSKEEIK